MTLSDILKMPIAEREGSGSNSVFLTDSYVGIEIEMENVTRSDIQGLSRWRTVHEGSVSGWELVLKKPMCTSELYLAVEELRTISGNINHEDTFTERTSNHVHVDVRDMTFVQLMNFLTLAVMFEPVLYKYVAGHRTSNHFCWSFLDCQNLITRIKTVCKAAQSNRRDRIRCAMQREFTQQETKYSGINLSSIPEYGSLEFRMHEGTMNTNKIIRWVNILLSIKEYAMGEGRTPENILQTKRDAGIDSIFTGVLGNYRGILGYPGVEKDILTGIRSSQDFVYQVTKKPPVVLPQGNPRGIFQTFLDKV